MKKIIISLFLNLAMCSVLFAESYHFNNCKISGILSAHYSIDFNKKIIEVKLEAADGTSQTFSDQIELIEKNRITSKKIKSGKSQDAFFVFYLDSESQSVIKNMFGEDYDTVSVNTIKNVMKLNGHEKIDLLKLDIEGAEVAVLTQMLDDEIYPTYLCVEFDLLLKRKDTYGETEKVIKTLLNMGYKSVFDGNFNFFEFGD